MIVHTRIESAHLAGNLLGDPSERDLFVYLPNTRVHRVVQQIEVERAEIDQSPSPR
jgi:hypothetical protein